MIDPIAIGTDLPELNRVAEHGRLRFFAKSIGETDPVYSDVSAARAAGYPDLLVPPTFLFCLELDQPDPFRYLTDLGVNIAHALHAEQSFEYYVTAFAGCTLTLRPKILDIYTKKNGALEFIVKQTTVRNEDEVTIAVLRSVIVVRNEAVAS